MLMAMPRSFSASVNATLVNWLPWSVLNISGWLCLAKASQDHRQFSWAVVNGDQEARLFGGETAFFGEGVVRCRFW